MIYLSAICNVQTGEGNSIANKIIVNDHFVHALGHIGYMMLVPYLFLTK